MEMNKKLVDFETYCKTCKYESTPENEDPCDHCLEVPARDGSHRPEKWKEKELKKGR